MKTLHLLAVGAAMIAAVGQAQGQTSPGGDSTVLACDVMGHDVMIYNRGDTALPAGTILHWSVWNGRREGDHTLEVALEPFIGLQLSSALGGSYFWNRPCAADVVEPSK